MAPLAAAAQSNEADCRLDNLPLASRPDVTAARIAAGAQRTHFVRDGTDVSGCPDGSPACRHKAFLVPGDGVILGVTRGAFVCASYTSITGTERSGWLPIEALTRESQPPTTLADWTGTWKRDEATITLTAGAGGNLIVKGEATWGARDAGRMDRGVHTGEIDARRAPDGPLLSFAMGETSTLSVDDGDESDCKVWMRLVGGRLLVEDNDRCGGVNVSFGGIYVRSR